MTSEYFEGKVKDKNIKQVPYKKRIGIFKYTTGSKPKHYATCSVLSCDKFLLEIEVTEEEYKKISIGENVSLFLRFKFEYACFHYSRPEPEPRVIEVRSSI